MNVMVQDSSKGKVQPKTAPSTEEINTTLNRIFDSASDAIRKNQQKVTLECVDRALEALFDAVNKVHLQGNKAPVPDFQKILGETNN